MAIEEWPSPPSCGNTNHIQWVRFRPAFNSANTAGKTGAWAVTKRSRSNGSAAVNWILGQVSLGELEDVSGFLAEIALSPEAPRHGHDVRCRRADHVDLAVVQRQF